MGIVSPLRLRDLERCFQGIVPATIATCSPDGIPNITYISIIHYVDDCHIGLSFQFFNKTRENILHNPRAQILLPDPETLEQYRIDARFVRTEREGAVFERMRINLAAVASQMSMQDVFRLQGADIYRVLQVEKLAHDLDLSAPEGPPDFVAALETLSTRLAECDDLEALLDTTLEGLAEIFDYPHSMILFTDEPGKRLYAVASHGFSSSGVGAEIAVGEGLIGTAARERRPVRVSHLLSEQIIAEAVRTTARERGHTMDPRREIPLPGLVGVQSQLAVPILARDRMLGVLCVQSTQRGRLTTADEKALSTLARHLATSILLLGEGPAGDSSNARVGARRPAAANAMKVRYHACDDSIFIEDDYLIKGLSGRILFWLLSQYERNGRVEFTNKQLRVEESLKLSGYRDNLEARLILLRRRLEERTNALRLRKSGRGRFCLEVDRHIELIRAS
jgi:adenylate cyclase